MLADEIRETYLSFFESEGHGRLASASLVPASHDPSVLLTTAGMQPLKPFFLGTEEPPARRLTSCQRCFRTTDIDQVGLTARHLTFFEMLGNFSIGDYFKEEAINFGWRLSLDGYGFDPEQVWVTVFAGDDELGLGPDEEAIGYWLKAGVPQDHIVRLPRSENFWQAGPVGPCGPCSELYLDRGVNFGDEDDRPGDDSERFLEYWNLVFMQYELHEDGSLKELPGKNIDTGMGLERMAAILQGVDSVFETDLLRPLVDLGEELSGARYGASEKSDRALRVLADHSRGIAFMVADGVVPSNEDRGYILRRILRRAIQQGRSIGIEAPFMTKFTDLVGELMAQSYPQVREQQDLIRKWTAAEEESFLRALDQGMDLLNGLITKARSEKNAWIDAAEAFQLHDTFGFPYDMTKDILAAEGLSVDDEGFHELMDQQRSKARMGTASAHGSEDDHSVVQKFAQSLGVVSDFVGYAKLEVDSQLLGLQRRNGNYLIKLAESPFYAEGGGQVADRGLLTGPAGSAQVVDVYRVGSDQVVEVKLDSGELSQGDTVTASVDAAKRSATAKNHTATHLLHAALRQMLGDHVHQAGSAVRPDKLRFDFSHNQPLSQSQIEETEDRVNRWISSSAPVRAVEMPRAEAEKLGAMALFGEKYGDWVRVVEVEAVSRELCGGTHVRNSAEIGVFKITGETSSSANVRRIEALTGGEAANLLMASQRDLEQLESLLKVGRGQAVDAVGVLVKKQQSFSEQEKIVGDKKLMKMADRLKGGARDIEGVKVVSECIQGVESKALRRLADLTLERLGDGAVVIATAGGDRFAATAKFSQTLVDRGVKADEVLGAALSVVGGRAGGRAEMAQGGGSDSRRVNEVLAKAVEEVTTRLGAS